MMVAEYHSHCKDSSVRHRNNDIIRCVSAYFKNTNVFENSSPMLLKGFVWYVSIQLNSFVT